MNEPTYRAGDLWVIVTSNNLGSFCSAGADARVFVSRAAAEAEARHLAAIKWGDRSDYVARQLLDEIEDAIRDVRF